MSATPILRYREYYTFQGYYRLEVSPSAAAGGTTGEEVFAACRDWMSAKFPDLDNIVL